MMVQVYVYLGTDFLKVLSPITRDEVPATAKPEVLVPPTVE